MICRKIDWHVLMRVLATYNGRETIQFANAFLHRE
jgi:hypothetical protein